MSEEQLADILGRPPRTLRQWRYVGRGPKYIKAGAAVRYRREDVEAWLEAQAQEPTDHRPAPLSEEGTTP